MSRRDHWIPLERLVVADARWHVGHVYGRGETFARRVSLCNHQPMHNSVRRTLGVDLADSMYVAYSSRVSREYVHALVGQRVMAAMRVKPVHVLIMPRTLSMTQVTSARRGPRIGGDLLSKPCGHYY